jgi:hypothetical protein
MLGTRRQLIPDAVIQNPRRGRRFSLVLPCHVTSPYTRSIRIAGTTLNMSRTGVLVRFYHLGASEALPQVGEVAPLEIDLPTGPSISPRILRCMAVVVRILEVETDHLAVAFELRRVRVEERHEKASFDIEAIPQSPTGSRVQ